MTPPKIILSGSFSSIKVSPERTFLQPTTAAISPTPISLKSYVSSALTLRSAFTDSTSFRAAFLIFARFLRVP